MARKQKTTLTGMFAEKINFGGTLMSRAQVAEVMTKEGQTKQAIDYFAFAPRALTPLQQVSFRAVCQCGCRMMSTMDRQIKQCGFCKPE